MDKLVVARLSYGSLKAKEELPDENY